VGDRLEALVARYPVRVRGRSLTLLLVRSGRRAADVRVTGLAAEMTYYALISLLPLLTATGAALGFLERFVGPDQVRDIEQALVRGLETVFAPQLTGDFLLPLVEGLLREERGGIALGSLAVALWLAGRMFRAAIRALDDAYRVEDRRNLLAQWGLGLALSLGAVATLVVVLAMVVVGPLLGGGQRLAAWLGTEGTFDTLWGVVRWPVVALICVGFLVVVYRLGPAVDNRWRDCLPGAILGTVGLIAVAVGFRVYLATAGPTTPGIGEATAAVAVAAQTLGAVLAGVLWLWLSSIVILVGGVLNAELQASRRRRLQAVGRRPGQDSTIPRRSPSRARSASRASWSSPTERSCPTRSATCLMLRTKSPPVSSSRPRASSRSAPPAHRHAGATNPASRSRSGRSPAACSRPRSSSARSNSSSATSYRRRVGSSASSVGSPPTGGVEEQGGDAGQLVGLEVVEQSAPQRLGDEQIHLAVDTGEGAAGVGRLGAPSCGGRPAGARRGRPRSRGRRAPAGCGAAGGPGSRCGR
jgi:membrane protein